MNKIVACVGLSVLASNLNPVYGQNASATPNKPWNISASLRGFYDDNINTLPSGNPNKVGSTGFSVSPGAGLNWSDDQTVISGSYLYTFLYYDKKPFGNSTHYDQDHLLNLALSHAFSERYQAAVKDSFVIGQEPDQIRAAYGGGALATFQRVPGDNIRNSAMVNLDAQLTPLFGLAVGYGNDFTHYQDHGASNIPGFGVGRIVNGAFVPGASESALLDRDENRINLDGRWQLQPQTVGVLGYMYGQVNYLSDEPIGNPGGIPSALTIPADSRNQRSHYFYAGADHNFLPDLSGSIRMGARYTDYFNDNHTDLNPYVHGNLQYNYAPESSVQLGINYDNTATDAVDAAANGFTRSIDALVLNGSINHRIVPNLFGSLVAQFQNSTFNGGGLDGKSEQYYLIGLDLQYRFNPYLAANIGYNYDKVESSDAVSRSFDRNRVYLGVTGSY